jgi:hypothetical protein
VTPETVADWPEILWAGQVTAHDGREDEGFEDLSGGLDSFIAVAQVGLGHALGVGGEIRGIEFEEELVGIKYSSVAGLEMSFNRNPGLNQVNTIDFQENHSLILCRRYLRLLGLHFRLAQEQNSKFYNFKYCAKLKSKELFSNYP